MLGGYGVLGVGATAQRTYDFAKYAGAQILLRTRYVAIDSWESELFRVAVDGTVTQSHAHTNAVATSHCGGAYEDVAYTLSTVLAGGAAVTLRYDTTLDSSASDESWGLVSLTWVVARVFTTFPSATPSRRSRRRHSLVSPLSTISVSRRIN